MSKPEKIFSGFKPFDNIDISTLTPEQKKKLNKEDNERINELQNQAEIDILKLVDDSGLAGFDLRSLNLSKENISKNLKNYQNNIELLLAAQRLSSNSNVYGSRRGLILVEKTSWIMVRKNVK